MAQKQKQYEDALGSIFDFIFEEAKKPPNKVKPVKVTGVDGSSEIVNAMTDILENPLLFVKDNSVQQFKDILDINVAQIRAGERRPSNIKFNVKDLGGLISNPNEFIDKQFKKMEIIRKSQRLAWAGESLKGVIGSQWARQQGLDYEAKKAMEAAGKVGHVKDTGWGIGGRTNKEFVEMATRADSLADKYLLPGSRALPREVFQNKYGLANNAWVTPYREYLKERQDYRLDSSKRAEVKAKKAWKRDFYTRLEGLDLAKKSYESRQAGDIEKAEDYIRASAFVENVFSPVQLKVYQRNQREAVKNISATISALKRSNDPQKERKIREAKAQVKKINRDLRTSTFEDMAGRLGQIEGGYASVKNLFIDGNLVSEIIGGGFFSDKYNNLSWLQPSDEARKISFGVGGKKRDMEFHAPRVVESRVGLPGALYHNYARSMNHIYYLSPVTWARSLVTGEIFAYQGFLNREKLEKTLTETFNNINVNTLIEKLSEGDSSDIEALISTLGSGSRVRKKLERYLRKDSRFGKLAYTFGTLGRWRKRVQDYLDEKIWRAAREKIGNYLMTKVSGEVALRLVGEWIASGGIGTLVKGLVTSVFTTLGFATTGIGGFVIWAASALITELGYKLAKPVAKLAGGIIVFSIIGFFGVFILYGSFYTMVFGQHSHVAPNEIVMCDAFEEMGYDYSDTGGLGSPIPGNLNVQCIEGESISETFNRIASDMGLSGAYLELITPADPRYGDMWERTYCISRPGGQIYCKAEKMASMSCQGAVNLLTHELVHQVQYGNGATGSYTSLFMEWGADYLTNNGGGYKFKVSTGGCIRASESKTPSSCSAKDLEGIAMNDPSYLTSPCFSALKLYVKDFCD